MKSSAKKIELASVDDLFSTEESRADAQSGKVFRKSRCLNCIRSKGIHSKSRMTKQ